MVNPVLLKPTHYTVFEGGPLLPAGDIQPTLEILEHVPGTEHFMHTPADQLRAEGWRNFVEISGQAVHSLAVIMDGQLIARWDCINGETDP